MAGIGCGAQCIKLTLVIFNILVSLAGLGLVVIGGWFLADNGAIHFLGIASDEDDTIEVVRASAITILIVGLCSMFVGLVGCWGACRQKTHCLNCYAVIIGVVIILQIVGAILAGVFHSKMTGGLLKAMNHTVQHDYGRIKPETDAWDYLQYELSCCGAAGPLDWKTSFWMHNQTLPSPVPKTCCVLKNSNLSDPQPVNTLKCFASVGGNATFGDKYLHQTGCERSLESWISSHVAILIGIAVAVIFLEVAVVLLSCVLRARINRGYEYV